MTHLNTNNNQKHKDPVCGMDVSSGNDAITYSFNNHKYYFCAPNCRDAFEKSPEAYQKENISFLRRWWNNYLKRLNKVTNGKPQCCD